MSGRIYLDNAATSWPKRPSVIEAVLQFVTHCGATAGRGTYRSALEADRWLHEARLQLSRLINAPNSNSIAFCSSGTHALNAALKGIIRDRQHVIATQGEHNSVLRPLMQLAREKGVLVDIVRSHANGVASLSHAAELLRPETGWLVVGHASNVTGAIQDLRAWNRLAERIGAGLIVDASQSLGYVPIDVQETPISVLATAGHKGLGGLPGTGFVYARPELQSQFSPWMTGGTGLHSESLDAQSTWPQVIEVGNHNLPGIISMAVAAKELLDEAKLDPVPWQKHWRKTMKRLVSGLLDIPGIAVVGYPSDARLDPPVSNAEPDDSEVDHVPLVSIQVDGWDAHDLAMVLDNSFEIEVRAGLHCAALIHDAIDSRTSGGTLRISPGHGSGEQDIDAVLFALRQILEGAPATKPM
jgi:selenocysteine lyase/cysteine desulfurase